MKNDHIEKLEDQLARFRKRGLDRLPLDAMDELQAAVRSLQTEDFPGLITTAFGEILGFATIMMLRCQLHVERSLIHARQAGANQFEIPGDLDSEDWLERVERISRFIAEMAATYARVQHVLQLGTNGPRRQPTGAVAAGVHTNGNGTAAPGNGRIRRLEKLGFA